MSQDRSPAGSRDARAWRQPEGKPASPAGGPGAPGRGKKIFALLAVMLALAGVIVGLIYWIKPRPEPYFLPLFITDYRAAEIPVIPLAQADREALCNSASLGERGYFGSVSAFTSQERRRLLDELEALKDREPARPVVVYLSAHARTGPSGEVFILPGDADVDDPTTWIRLREVLELFRACAARHRLLILDIMRPLADPFLGVLANDVAAQVQADLRAVEDSGRLVLCACSPWQVSLSCEPLGRSVFSYYFEEGLRGWADAYNPRQVRDGRVTVQELAEFVVTRTHRWSTQLGAFPQTPLLVGSADDFPLVVLPDGQPRAAPEPPLERAFPQWLRLGWKQRDEWRTQGISRRAPRAFRDLESHLFRAEQFWRGGVDLSRHLEYQLADFKAERARVERIQSARQSGPALSLAEAQDRGAKPDAAVIELVKQTLAAINKAKVEEADKIREEQTRQFGEKTKGASQFAVAWTVFQEALEAPTPDRLRALDQLLGPRAPKFVETHCLRRLAARSKERGVPTRVAQRALAAVAAGEQAAAAPPHTLPWLRALLDEAFQTQSQGLSLVFSRPGTLDDGRWTDAEELLGRALDQFALIRYHQQMLEDGRRTWDEGVSLLPAYARYLEHAPDQEAVWWESVESGARLGELLVPPPADAAATAEAQARTTREVADLTGTLSRGLQTLQRPWQEEALKRLRELTSDGRRGDPKLGALLATPLPSAAERAEIWTAEQSLARRLLDRVLELDHEESARARSPRRPPRWDAREAEQMEKKRAVMRARIAIHLLRLAGGAGAADLQAKLGQAGEAQLSDPVWQELSSALRRAWTQGLAEKLRRNLERGDLARADQLFRLLLPVAGHAEQPRDRAGNPTAKMQQQQQRAFWLWQAERYGRASEDRSAPAETVKFFAEASRWYREQAARGE
jgi:hypothetical protein